MSTVPPAVSLPEVVMVGDTEVAMEPIDQLTGRRDDLLARSQTDDTQAQQLLADAAAKYRDAGAFLV